MAESAIVTKMCRLINAICHVRHLESRSDKLRTAPRRNSSSEFRLQESVALLTPDPIEPPGWKRASVSDCHHRAVTGHRRQREPFRILELILVLQQIGASADRCNRQAESAGPGIVV